MPQSSIPIACLLLSCDKQTRLPRLELGFGFVSIDVVYKLFLSGLSDTFRPTVQNVDKIKNNIMLVLRDTGIWHGAEKMLLSFFTKRV